MSLLCLIISTNEQISMTKSQTYDLKTRTFRFAQNVRRFVKAIPKDLCNYEDCKQLTRSSGSVGANYFEADESVSKKDFYYRLALCKKGAKESAYWLSLISVKNQYELKEKRKFLINETNEFVKIFAPILNRRT